MMDTVATLTLLLDRVVDGRELRPDTETTAAILAEAARFSERHLAPLAARLDREGCRLEAGRVKTAAGHGAAWRAFAEAGWTGITAPEDVGGQGLPRAIATAVQELFDADNPAFGMLAINTRCAIGLLAQNGDQAMRSTWLPKLASGAWAATICISEPQAGSDVGRIRTRAVEGSDGIWRLTGEKCWISYGDHDITERIGHFALARPQGAPPGTRGLTLFLVSDSREDGLRNAVVVSRLEEKLGLHGSPTCVLAFDESEAVPIGPIGRGLPTLFAMIVAMRLSVAGQGAAVAQAAASVAERYAAERGQGGDSDGPPTLINTHAEVRHLLLRMRARAEAARLIALQTAAWLDAGDAGDAVAAARATMMLPVAKTYCSETAIANADAAIQVLGGAGYVKEWPVERMLRDARVFSIYEGTTAIQGLDLVQRRVLASGGSEILAELLDRLEPSPSLREITFGTAAGLVGASPKTIEAAAVPLLRLLGLAAADGLLRRAGRQADALARRYTALAEFNGAEAQDRAEHLRERCRRGSPDAIYDAVFSAPRALSDPIGSDKASNPLK
jgi:alkylation response protein AidB-like acyl-CoA dehydrogenase